MPKRKKGPEGSNLPELVDPRLMKALAHVLRQHILLAAVQDEVSPKGLAKTLGEGVSQISYHVKVLREECDGLIEEARTEQRRGAVEHYYRASAKTLLPAKGWHRLRKGLRAAVCAGQASNLFEDLAAALEAGKLRSGRDHIARTPLLLDEKGQRSVLAIARRASREVEDEQRNAADRIAKTNGDVEKAACVFATMAFETAWQPADPHDRADGDPGTAPGEEAGQETEADAE